MLSLPEMKKKQIVFVFSNEGDKLSFSNDNIVVKDKEGKIKHQSTCYKLFMVAVVGNISITSGILQRLCYMSNDKNYEGLSANL